jgi:hypothetical protein
MQEWIGESSNCGMLLDGDLKSKDDSSAAQVVIAAPPATVPCDIEAFKQRLWYGAFCIFEQVYVIQAFTSCFGGSETLAFVHTSASSSDLAVGFACDRIERTNINSQHPGFICFVKSFPGPIKPVARIPENASRLPGSHKG